MTDLLRFTQSEACGLSQRLRGHAILGLQLPSFVSPPVDGGWRLFIERGWELRSLHLCDVFLPSWGESMCTDATQSYGEGVCVCVCALHMSKLQHVPMEYLSAF